MAYFTDIDQTATAHGFTLTARIEPDYDHGTPWDECDGHGPVSEWTTRDKAPGELILHQDRRSRLYYDFAEACRIARRDGWGPPQGYFRADAKPTKGEIAAAAAMADYERLRAWCNDEWYYVGVIVTASRNGIELGSASLWGIESDAGDYLLETVNELADEAIATARDAIAALTE